MAADPNLSSAIEAFKARWLDSQSAERSNSQLFLTELTDLMVVPHPSRAVNDPVADTYIFERKVRLAHSAGDRVGWIDRSQVALIRDLVFAAPRGAIFSVSEIAARFKRSKPADIETILDAITAQGFLVAFEAEDGRRWARPARAA